MQNWPDRAGLRRARDSDGWSSAPGRGRLLDRRSSRDESAAQAGVTHLIEHPFKGTDRHSALEIAEIFDGLGGELNAATSREHTLVYARVPDHHLETAVEVMSDMVFSPALAELETEREVVLEEIAMYEDTPQELVHDLISEAVFGDHPLGRPVIGTAEVISSIPRDDIAQYHDRLYVPANIVVAGAGNVEHDRLIELVNRELEQPGTVPKSGVNIRPRSCSRCRRGWKFQRKDTEQYHRLPRRARHLALGPAPLRRVPARRDPRRLGVVAAFQEIREKRGMAYAVYSFVSQYTDTGQIGIYVGTREDNLGEALAIAADQIGDIASGKRAPCELDRAKENLKGRILLSMESTSARMNRLGKALISDSELLSLERLVAEIDAVDAESVCGLAAALLEPERLSAAGSARTRSGSSRPSSASRPRSRVRRERPAQRASRSRRLGAGAGARGRGPHAGRTLDRADAMIDFTRPDAVA
jgi:predicted Zn-dependent peptidase